MSLMIIFKIQFVENVALNKPAFQLHPYVRLNKTFVASNAVDGLKSNLSWMGGQCAVSDVEKKIATWWVNLGSLYNIHHITVYFRTDNAIWGNIYQLYFLYMYYLIIVIIVIKTRIFKIS